MTTKTFSHALGEIGDKYLNEAVSYTSVKKKNSWLKWGAMAACLCLVVAGVIRLSIGFLPNQGTDIYRVGTSVEIFDMSELAAVYPGDLLADNLNLSVATRTSVELYYDDTGSFDNVADWYSLLVSADYTEYEMTMFCMFGNTSVEDWKVDMVFTDEATETININGITVQIARRNTSLGYEYAHYAIFEYDGVVYDIRTESDDENRIYEVVTDIIG